VQFAPDPPYYFATRSIARKVILTPIAPEAEAAEGVIAPGQTKTFWSAWPWPQKCDLAAARLRLTVTDLNARMETVEFPSHTEASGKTSDMPSGIEIGGAVNLDPAGANLYGRDRCERSLGKRHNSGAL
jgi:hypothetical protein